jgi:hypothetical protein
MLSALVLVSLVFTTSVKACEDEPLTLLSVYMNSDLVVLAKFDSESNPTKSNEDEYGYTLETQRKLVLTKIYKGQSALQTVTFSYLEYVQKIDENSSEVMENYPEEEHYFDVSKMKIGEEYLFFLKNEKETGKIGVTDYMSGVREIGKNLSFYEKQLDQLGKIASAKENQYELLTEWIVKNIENEETREDAIRDLAESFYNLKYQDEMPEFKGKGPFVVNEDGYGIYTVGVAERLTQSQKNRISNVLYPMLQEAWGAEKPQYVNYGISAILSGIDKRRIVLYTHNFLQNVDKKDTERTNLITEFFVDTIGDETYSTIYFEIQEIEYKIEEAKNVNTPQGRKQLKDLINLKNAKYIELENRFNFLESRNFIVAEKVSEK